MDYSKMLFAFAVRELTIARLGFQSEGMTQAEKEAYRDANNRRIINEIVEEVQFVADVIENGIATSANAIAVRSSVEPGKSHH